MCAIDDIEGDAWLARAEQAAAAMPEEERKQRLLRSDYSPCRCGDTWGVLGYNGFVSYNHPTERDAENSIIINQGAFDDI